MSKLKKGKATMNNKNGKEKSIFLGKDTLTLRSFTDVLLPEAWHYGPQHKLAPIGDNYKMIMSVGITPDHIRFTCPWCHFCFEIEWTPGMPLEKIAEQVRNTISSQSHD